MTRAPFQPGFVDHAPTLREVPGVRSRLTASPPLLVTLFVDPGLTRLSVSLGGLATEVGGRITHGAVIESEYGSAAVVGVERAIRVIRMGDPSTCTSSIPTTNQSTS